MNDSFDNINEEIADKKLKQLNIPNKFSLNQINNTLKSKYNADYKIYLLSLLKLGYLDDNEM